MQRKNLEYVFYAQTSMGNTSLVELGAVTKKSSWNFFLKKYWCEIYFSIWKKLPNYSHFFQKNVCEKSFYRDFNLHMAKTSHYIQYLCLWQFVESSFLSRNWYAAQSILQNAQLSYVSHLSQPRRAKDVNVDRVQTTFSIFTSGQPGLEAAVQRSNLLWATYIICDF